MVHGKTFVRRRTRECLRPSDVYEDGLFVCNLTCADVCVCVCVFCHSHIRGNLCVVCVFVCAGEKMFHKDSHEEVDIVWEKMSKSKFNGIEPEVWFNHTLTHTSICAHIHTHALICLFTTCNHAIIALLLLIN